MYAVVVRYIQAKERYTGCIYDWDELFEFLANHNMSDSSTRIRLAYSDLVKLVKGTIDIEKPSKSCNGAWEVKASAVKMPGLGKDIYDLAYAMSPTHSLISDRNDISAKAINGWLKFSKNNSGKKLDDINNPQNSDPNDDCFVWKGDQSGKVGIKNSRRRDILPADVADVLNRSYSKQAVKDWESIMQSTQEKLKNMYSSQEIYDGVVYSLIKAGDNLFAEKYDNLSEVKKFIQTLLRQTT